MARAEGDLQHVHQEKESGERRESEANRDINSLIMLPARAMTMRLAIIYYLHLRSCYIILILLARPLAQAHGLALWRS
jgi:hypothetical protein